MDAIILQVCDKSRSDQQLARQYGAAMVDSRQVRAALRQLRTDANMSPEEFADDAKVNRATVYRIEALESNYSPRIDTVSALVAARGLTLSEFFGKIEGLTPTRKTEAELPSSTPLNPEADHGRSVLSDIDRTFILAIGEALAESFDRAVDRLAAARSQAAPTRSSEPVRRARRRKVG